MEPSYPLLSYYVFKNRAKDFKYLDFQISTYTNLLVLYYFQAINNVCGNQYSYKGPPRKKKKMQDRRITFAVNPVILRHDTFCGYKST